MRGVDPKPLIFGPDGREHRPVIVTSERTDITRSFSYKLNIGNYQAVDFFCSQRVECAIDDAETVSDAVYQFCKREVMKSVREFQQSKATMERADMRGLEEWKNQTAAPVPSTRRAG